ncbi:MAG TPA: LacI family DNA-binding transcriptional regulator [Mycobacteriales bacterium]|jgi:DNA-binding LacI/PurR family transcriptional regulator|nr:LacI family DNA-binding transcriptional regulator [Mycobacteriales bacterium]
MRATRPSINDIARQAQVSTTAVSYALNDRPGVSDSTRARIVAIADDLGWRPSSAARSLHSTHTNALGLVTIGPEADSAYFLFEFLIGVQAALVAHDVLLVLHTAADIDDANEIYRRWRAEHRVDGIILLNPLIDDPRIPLLTKLDIPSVIVGDARRSSTLPSVWTDDWHAANIAVEHLVGLGHRRIARIGLQPQFLHSKIRSRAITTAMSRAGLPTDLSAYHGDIPPHELILQMLRSDSPPTAAIFEDPTVAVRTTAALQKAGVTIPDELSVIAWDENELCRLVQPTLTTLRRDVREYGRRATRRLVAAVAGELTGGHVKGTTTQLVVRDSTIAPN